MVVLNRNRQIVYMNEAFAALSNISDLNEVLGQRPGEVFDCVFIDKTAGEGCGTVEFCKKCGAVNSILTSYKGWQSTQECLITSKSKKAYDLEVTSSPFNYANAEYTIFSIKDISDQNRRNMLERLFFHDVLNSVGGILGLAEILNDSDNIAEYHKMAGSIQKTAENLMVEITSQQQLLAAERGELKIELSQVESIAVLDQICEVYGKHEALQNRVLSIVNTAEHFNFKTDIALLRRVVGNMTKNALEASKEQSKVKLNVYLDGGKPVFSVHNDVVISKGVQLQIFKRSFSTKGTGRGLGTYSMKLLGEKYLGGEVWFESDAKIGTTFYIRLPKN